MTNLVTNMALNTNSIDLELSSSQYLSITDASQTGLDITGDFSLACWVKLESTPANSNCLLGKADAGAPTTDGGYFIRFQQASGASSRVACYYNDSSGNQSRAVSDTEVSVNGQWDHYVATADVSAASIILYRNGSSIGTYNLQTAATSVRNNSEPFLIGAIINLGSANNFIDGLMDEVAVYNTILSASDVTNLYDDYQHDGTETGLVSAWRLNNDLTDESSNGNDLTNIGSAVFSTDVPFPGSGAAGFAYSQAIII